MIRGRDRGAGDLKGVARTKIREIEKRDVEALAGPLVHRGGRGGATSEGLTQGVGGGVGSTLEVKEETHAQDLASGEFLHDLEGQQGGAGLSRGRFGIVKDPLGGVLPRRIEGVVPLSVGIGIRSDLVGRGIGGIGNGIFHKSHPPTVDSENVVAIGGVKDGGDMGLDGEASGLAVGFEFFEDFS